MFVGESSKPLTSVAEVAAMGAGWNNPKRWRSKNSPQSQSCFSLIALLFASSSSPLTFSSWTPNTSSNPHLSHYSHHPFPHYLPSSTPLDSPYLPFTQNPSPLHLLSLSKLLGFLLSPIPLLAHQVFDKMYMVFCMFEYVCIFCGG